MAALDSPASSSSPFTAPNGVIYTWNADGYWEAKSDPSDLDSDYLKLDATNGPVTGPLAFEGLTTHEAGVNVTGDGSVTNGLDYFSDQMQLRYKSQSLINLREGRSATDYQVRFTGRQQIDYTPVNDAPVISILPTINGQSSWQTDIFTVKPTLTGSFSSLIGLNLDFKEGIASGTSITADNFYGVKLARTNQITTGTGSLYGIYTEVQGSGNYNFYAAGNSLNYFKGGLNCEGEVNVQVSGQGTNFPGFGNTIKGFRVQPSGVSSFSANHANSTDFVTNFNRSNFNGTLLSFRKNGTERGSIFIDDSNISILGQTSDYRVKKNIQPLASTVDKVKALNIVNFEYTDRAPGVIQEGFVAHELAEICPKAVVGTKDATEAIGTLADYDGTVLETAVTEPEAEELTYTEEVETDGVATMVTRTRTWTPSGTRPVYQGVDQTKIIPLLTKALQEALDKIETLETRLSDAGIA